MSYIDNTSSSTGTTARSHISKEYVTSIHCPYANENSNTLIRSEPGKLPCSLARLKVERLAGLVSNVGPVLVDFASIARVVALLLISLF